MKKFALKAPELSVRNRLRAVFGLLGLMLIAGAVIGIGGMQQQNDGMGKIYDEEIVPTQLVSQISQRSLMSFILMGEASSLVGKQPDQVKAKIAEYDKLQTEMEGFKKQFEALPKSEEVKKHFADWRSSDADYKDAKDSLLDALDRK